MPINFVRFGDDAPTPAGTYIHAGELRHWLAEEGYDELADEIRLLEEMPPTIHTELVSWGQQA